MKDLDLSKLASDESFLNFCFQRNSLDTAFWEKWLNDYPEERKQIEELKNTIFIMAQPASEKVIHNDYQKLQESIKAIDQPFGGVKRLWPYLSVVAAAIAFIVIGLYFYSHDKFRMGQDTFGNDIAPGKQTATLTLSSGRKIRLSDADKGELAKEAGVMISKTEDGQVVYKVLDQPVAENDAMNTLTTARGEAFAIILPDGTKVALNASSSLRYPVYFADRTEGGGERNLKRIVALKGEGYFEVSTNKQRPFVVQTADQEVQVLGTHFNINAYSNEKNIKTTLLEGSVKVSNPSGSKIISPGEQAVNDHEGIKILTADLDAVVAWQRGKFVFKDESLGSIMRKVERWYDVQVVYDGVSENLPFWGSVSRFENISKILETLQLTGSVHFKVEGKKITVTK